MIVIVDYGRGNLYSINQALRHLNAECSITDDPEKILSASRIILPGVGAFGAAMKDLIDKQLVSPIQEAAKKGIPLLGICLGMQLLGDQGEEFGLNDGLGLIPGTVKRLPEGDGSNGAMRIPNTGWRMINRNGNDSTMSHLPDSNWLYFVHSYSLVVVDLINITASISVNGSEVAAAVRKDNVMSYQFHPEKSGETGMQFLKYFLDLPRASH